MSSSTGVIRVESDTSPTETVESVWPSGRRLPAPRPSDVTSLVSKYGPPSDYRLLMGVPLTHGPRTRLELDVRVLLRPGSVTVTETTGVETLWV